jgi:hypothetical protein
MLWAYIELIWGWIKLYPERRNAWGTLEKRTRRTSVHHERIVTIRGISGIEVLLI